MFANTYHLHAAKHDINHPLACECSPRTIKEAALLVGVVVVVGFLWSTSIMVLRRAENSVLTMRALTTAFHQCVWGQQCTPSFVYRTVFPQQGKLALTTNSVRATNYHLPEYSTLVCNKAVSFSITASENVASRPSLRL